MLFEYVIGPGVIKDFEKTSKVLYEMMASMGDNSLKEGFRKLDEIIANYHKLYDGTLGEELVSIVTNESKEDFLTIVLLHVSQAVNDGQSLDTLDWKSVLKGSMETYTQNMDNLWKKYEEGTNRFKRIQDDVERMMCSDSESYVKMAYDELKKEGTEYHKKNDEDLGAETVERVLKAAEEALKSFIVKYAFISENENGVIDWEKCSITALHTVKQGIEGCLFDKYLQKASGGAVFSVIGEYWN